VDCDGPDNDAAPRDAQPRVMLQLNAGSRKHVVGNPDMQRAVPSSWYCAS